MEPSRQSNGCAVALIGAGQMAREHARAFADVPGVSLVGIQSRTRARAERLADEFGIARVCDTLGELYESSTACLVVVAVSESAGGEVAEACCRFPWVVFLEKPPGLTPAEARRIRQCAREMSRTVIVGLNRRFYSGTQTVLEELKKEDGTRHIDVHDQQNQGVATDLGMPDRVVAHWMYVNSIHLIDYFRVFGRSPIASVTPVFPWTPDPVPPVVAAKIEFENGDTGLYEAVWRVPVPWAASVTTAGRRWELRPLEQLRVQRSGERTLEPIDPSPWDRAFKPGFRLQAEQAVAAALGRHSRSVTLDDALETMDLVSTIYGLA